MRTTRLLLLQLPSLVVLIFRLIRDPRVALVDKMLFGAVVAYVLAPVDLVPDILLPLGLIDDLYLVGLALTRLLGRAGPDLLLEHWDGDPHALGHLIEGVDQIGSVLPARVRRSLQRVVRRAR